VSLRHRESGNRDYAVCEAAAGPRLARIRRITGLGTGTIMRIVSKARLVW
jgi:hypothetical protein